MSGEGRPAEDKPESTHKKTDGNAKRSSGSEVIHEGKYFAKGENTLAS